MPYVGGMQDDLHKAAHPEEQESERRRKQRLALAILAASIAFGMGALVYAVKEVARTQPSKVVIDPAKLPPVRANPGG